MCFKKEVTPTGLECFQALVTLQRQTGVNFNCIFAPSNDRLDTGVKYSGLLLKQLLNLQHKKTLSCDSEPCDH